MAAEFDKLIAESKTLKNEYLRSLAEFENFRRRKEKEVNDFREFANEAVLLAIVPVLDNLGRALQAADAESADADLKAQYESMKNGIRLIFQQLKETLGKFGFQEYSSIGEVFDPRRCEAVAYTETDEHPERTVISEAGKGYTYRDRVLRPALVIVAKPLPKSEPDPKS